MRRRSNWSEPARWFSAHARPSRSDRNGGRSAGLYPSEDWSERSLADYLLANFNTTGAVIATAIIIVLSLYLVSSFSMAKLAAWLAGPMAFLKRLGNRFESWRDIRRQKRLELYARPRRTGASARGRKAGEEAAALSTATRASPRHGANPSPNLSSRALQHSPNLRQEPESSRSTRRHGKRRSRSALWKTARSCADVPAPAAQTEPEPVVVPLAADPDPVAPAPKTPVRKQPSAYRKPPTEMLNEPQGRLTYDSQELKDIAARIKAKFEEFNVMGSVVQINPGPVVTTFEFKPEAGIKYSRITTLTEDLCLGLQAESILIERIPGKPTVGIEVPEQQARSHQPAPDARVRRVPQLAVAADDFARQGHQRPHQSGGARIDAAPADRRLHRIGQERHAQHDDHVDSL